MSDRIIETHKFKRLISKNKSKISYLNSGGCICFAYILANHLEKLGINYEIVVFDSIRIWYHKYLLKYWMKRKNSNRISFRHVVLKIGDFYVDGYNIYNEKQIKNTAGFKNKLNLEQLSICYTHGSWRDLYNRSQNTLVYKLIKAHIK